MVPVVGAVAVATVVVVSFVVVAAIRSVVSVHHRSRYCMSAVVVVVSVVSVPVKAPVVAS